MKTLHFIPNEVRPISPDKSVSVAGYTSHSYSSATGHQQISWSLTKLHTESLRMGTIPGVPKCLMERSTLDYT